MIGLQPKTARVVRDGKELDIPICEVGMDETVRVRARVEGNAVLFGNLKWMDDNDVLLGDMPAQASLADAYALLNVAPQASDDKVKKAYRRLLSRHHPDKLVAKGLPEEMMKLASECTHQIRTACEQIRNHRGF